MFMVLTSNYSYVITTLKEIQAIGEGCKAGAQIPGRAAYEQAQPWA